MQGSGAAGRGVAPGGRPGAGVIEGFYGPPWSHEARLGMLRFLAEVGLEHYAYAPKNDPFHRDRWREPAPPEQIESFRELAGEAARAGVALSYCLAPQKLFGRANLRAVGGEPEPWGLEQMLAKLGAFQAAGVRSFGLLFDDTLATFAPRLATARAGRLHARTARAVLRALCGRDPSVRVFLTPSVYLRTWDRLPPPAQRYWKALRELPAGVPVAWTGAGVFARKITGAQVARFREETGLDLLIWNNAVANDFVPLSTGGLIGLRGREKLSFGPPENLAADLRGSVAGVLLNGAREPVLTRIPLACLAEWWADPGAYDPEAAHRRALRRVAGGEAGAAVLADLYAFTCRHRMASPWRIEGRSLADRVAALESDPRSPAAREALGAELERLRALPERARKNLPPALADEVGPTAEKLHRLAEAGLAALAGRPEEARRRQRDARRIRFEVGEGPFRKLVQDAPGRPPSAAGRRRGRSGPSRRPGPADGPEPGESASAGPALRENPGRSVRSGPGCRRALGATRVRPIGEA